MPGWLAPYMYEVYTIQIILTTRWRNTENEENQRQMIEQHGKKRGAVKKTAEGELWREHFRQCRNTTSCLQRLHLSHFIIWNNFSPQDVCFCLQVSHLAFVSSNFKPVFKYDCLLLSNWPISQKRMHSKVGLYHISYHMSPNIKEHE